MDVPDGGGRGAGAGVGGERGGGVELCWRGGGRPGHDQTEWLELT